MDEVHIAIEYQKVIEVQYEHSCIGGTEQAIERLPFRDLMAGKIFALLITKKGIPFIGPAGLF